MHASQVTPEVVHRANDLYWGSDTSVNQIADDLELSKGALYGIIEPETSGLGCPLCGDEVVFSNRTAKDKGMLDCPTCDWDGSPDETVDVVPSTPPASSNGAPTSRQERAADPDTDADESAYAPERLPPKPIMRPSTTTVAGGALIGAAVGLALVMWARRR
ncbi:MAG: hypothetical protein HKN72_04620 [Gemmatimonadetes bacterium]|nr:hypothetical protein [Gemmatimonadota bacterium]NNF12478.1 hypothetical protein [Gemmatimonadota bacterium]NNL31520.1 hypothetical protein [Gemmatimonadota bacterium]